MAPENETPGQETPNESLPENTVPEFNVNSDGEMVVTNVPGDESDEVTNIWSKPVSKTKISESGKEPPISTTPAETLFEQPKEETPRPVTPTTDLDIIRNENEQLKARLARLEESANAVQQTKTKEELDAAEAEYNAEVNQAITELFGDSLDDEAKVKFAKLIDKVASRRAGDSSEQIKTMLQANEMASSELREVFKIYDGQEGRPAVYQMNGLVTALVNTYGKDLWADYPMSTIFRAAENVPFMNFIASKHPEAAKNMSFQQMVVASEKVREMYYQGRTGSRYEHLAGIMTGGKNNNNTAPPVDNNKINELQRDAQNLSSNRGVGVSAGETNLVKRPDAAITSARSAVERALSELNIK